MSDKYKEKDITIFYKLSGISLLIGIIIALIVYNYAPKSQKKEAFTTILGISIMVGAFIPQLYHNSMEKAKATDNILAIFLVLTCAGVLLRIPVIKTQIQTAKKTKVNILISILIGLSQFIPLIMHNTWQWQCVLYNSKKGEEQKKILSVIAPILSILIVILFIWVFIL